MVFWYHQETKILGNSNSKLDLSPMGCRSQRKIFFLVRPAIEYRISNDSNKSNSSTPLFLNLSPPKERGTFEIRTVKYIFYEDGEEVQAVGDIDTQLVHSCLVLNWGSTKTFIKEAYASLINVKINKMIKTFLQISLVKYCNAKGGGSNSDLI